jgi:hypothetical protein
MWDDVSNGQLPIWLFSTSYYRSIFRRKRLAYYVFGNFWYLLKRSLLFACVSGLPFGLFKTVFVLFLGPGKFSC